MLVKTFSRLYFFAFFIVFAIYISDTNLTTSDKMQIIIPFITIFLVYLVIFHEASFSTFFPLIFTFSVVSLRELYFEKRRGKKDEMVNKQQCTIIRKFREENLIQDGSLNHNSSLQNILNQDELEHKQSQKVQIYQHIKWQDLKIGDIVLLKKDDICPSDILILDMFDYQCTVNTQNIDDKSDEKIKTASDLMFLPKNSKIKGNHVEYRKLLTGKFNFKGIQDTFKGLVKLKKDPIAQELTSDQFIMRGSKIQFTEWILGLVIEIGMQTYIYRKFKRPQIIYYNSTFMRKQFAFSIITIAFIIVLIFLNLAFTEINQCLKDGFAKIEAKLILSALLNLPVYYHAISEFLISLYCIYINIKQQKQDQIIHKKSQSIDNNNQNQLQFSQNDIRQNYEMNSHVHLKKESDFLKEENNTLAALKTCFDDKYNFVNLNDCLSQMNDTRSIVDMCLTTHLVFNTANTLTTGQNCITGLLISNNIYQIDTAVLKKCMIRRRDKKETLINLQQSLQNNFTKHSQILLNGNQHTGIFQDQTIQGKHRSGIPSIVLTNYSNNHLLVNQNYFSNTNINQFGNAIHNPDLERVIEEERLQEQNSKGYNTIESKQSSVYMNQNNILLNSQAQNTQSKQSQIQTNCSDGNNKIINNILQQSDVRETAKQIGKRDNHRSATNIENSNNDINDENALHIEEEHFLQNNTKTNLPFSLLKPVQIDSNNIRSQKILNSGGNLEIQLQDILISENTPFSRQKDKLLSNHLSEEINKNLTATENKMGSTGTLQNTIEVELHSTKDPNQKISLINNKNFDNFVNSLEYHKQNDHRIPQLNPKKIVDLDSPFPESDGEVNSPRRQKKILKRIKSTEVNLKELQEIQKSNEGSNQTAPSNLSQKNQLSDQIRSTVVKGVRKTINKNEEIESNTYTINSGKSSQTFNKYRSGSSTLRLLANQLNSGVNVNQILETKEFANLYSNDDSINSIEAHDIMKAMLLCHYTRSFYDEDTHKIKNCSFQHLEELQLQFGNSIGYDFEFSCYIDGDFYYVLKKDNQYQKYKIIAYHYYQSKERFCILIQQDDQYVIYIKEEISTISTINYLNEIIISDLMAVCNYYRYQGNRTILYCKKEISHEEVKYFIQKMEQKQSLSSIFNHELNQQTTQFLTLLAVKEQTVSGLDTLFKQLKDAKIKSWIATGEKQSKVVPICFSAGKIIKTYFLNKQKKQSYAIIFCQYKQGILDKMHKNITFESEEYDKLAFQIRNMLQQLKDGFQKVYNIQKQGNDIIQCLNMNRSSRESDGNLNEGKQNLPQVGSVGMNFNKKSLSRQKSHSNSKYLRSTSRKSIVSGMELENQFKFSVLVSGKSFKEILKSNYLYNHFTFICYFAQSVVGYDMTPELKAQLLKVINTKMNQSFKTMFIGETLADFQAFTDSNISAHKKSHYNNTQNYPGIQFDKIENLLSLLLFHSKMIAEICEDALYFNLYRGVIFIFVLLYQYQLCDVDYSMINLGTLLFLSFFLSLIQPVIIIFKKYHKYKQSQLHAQGLIGQFGTLKQYSNIMLLSKSTKLFFICLMDASVFFFFIHFLISESTALNGQTFSVQFKVYLEQYFALAVIPLIRFLLEYKFSYKNSFLVSFILLIIPLISFSFDPNIRTAIAESFVFFREPQYLLTILFIPLFTYALNVITFNYVMVKTFPLIKTVLKMQQLVQDSIRESFFIKPKQFNIAKLIREIFQNNEPDIILSSYILSEQANVREASMNKWTLQFKDQNVETRFLSQYQKKTIQYSKIISSISFIFIEILILYRSILYEGGSFSQFNPSFYTIYFLGAFFIFSLQIFICFGQKYQKFSKQINYLSMTIRIVYFLILINISDVYDSIPGTLICIFLSIIMLPLVRLDFIFFICLLILIIISLREFNLISSVKTIQDDQSVQSLSAVHILFSHIEISLLFFLSFMIQKRKVNYISFQYLFLINFENQKHEEIERKNFQVNQTLTQATQKMKDTLSILLPRFIREKLYSGQNYDKISTNQGNIAVLFCDITNFDEIMMEEEEKIVKVLDNLFRQFDKSCQSNQVLKIETVGKTYMAAAGLRDIDDYYQDGQNTVNSSIDPVKRCLQVALEMQETAKNTTWGNPQSGKSGKVEIKIGINYGTVISGVIGFHKPQFSLIGDTVNTASRVCSTGQYKTINISASSFSRVCHLHQYRFSQKQVEAKGKGIITTYVVSLNKSNSMHGKISQKKMHEQDLILQKQLLNKIPHTLQIKYEQNQDNQNLILSNDDQSTIPNKVSHEKHDNKLVHGSSLGQSLENQIVSSRQRKRSGTYFTDTISKFGQKRLSFGNENHQNNKVLQNNSGDLSNKNPQNNSHLDANYNQKQQFNSSEQITQNQGSIPNNQLSELNKNIQTLGDKEDHHESPNNNGTNKSSRNSSNNLHQGFRTKMNSIFQSTSNKNIMSLHDEIIEPIHNAELNLGIEHKIDIHKLSNHGLNLSFYDFKTIKMQYQEEKDDISQDKSNIKNKNCLQMSYWRGSRIAHSQLEKNLESDYLLNEFWSSQMDDSLVQMKTAIKLTFIQILLYTLTLFLKIGKSDYNLIIIVRCVLQLFIIAVYFISQIVLKSSQYTLNKCRFFIIVFYFIIFASLNVELWIASDSTSKADFHLYNTHELREIVNVLVYEIYFVYLLFFRLRVFSFVQQISVFSVTFIVLMVHYVCVDLIFEGIIFKVIYLQLIFIFNSQQLFQKDLENFNTLKSLNEKNQQTDKLIQYLLPNHILQRFLMNPTASYIIAEKFDKQTILFADIAGFTRYSDQNQPETVVKMLRTIFTEFDQKCQHHKVFKVYTIGDCYVILGNTNHENRDPPHEAYNVIMMAFQMIEILSRTTELVENQIDMRIGVHTVSFYFLYLTINFQEKLFFYQQNDNQYVKILQGKIVGGLVGTQIVRYDIYGADVMIANKMESNGQKGRVVVSEATKEMLQESHTREFIFTEKGDVYIKSIDTNIKTYFCDKNPQ